MEQKGVVREVLSLLLCPLYPYPGTADASVSAATSFAGEAAGRRPDAPGVPPREPAAHAPLQHPYLDTRVGVLFLSMFIGHPWVYFLFEMTVLEALRFYMIRRHEKFCCKLYQTLLPAT